MDNTEVGSKGKLSASAEEVAKQGIEALLAGKDHVYAGSVKTKLEGMISNAVPGDLKASMHEKMAKPKAAGSE